MVRTSSRRLVRLGLIAILLASMGMMLPAYADGNVLEPVVVDRDSIPPYSLKWVGGPSSAQDQASHRFEALVNTYPGAFAGLAFSERYEKLQVFYNESQSDQAKQLVAGLKIDASIYEMIPRVNSRTALSAMQTKVSHALKVLALDVNGLQANFHLDGVVVELAKQPSQDALVDAADTLGPLGVVAFALNPSTGEVFDKDGPVDVYTQEGQHTINGREWRTSCEPYSQTIRCRTEIKAHTVEIMDGDYVKSYDWAFNNLTYVASPHALWKTNPLANANGRNGFELNGRQWKTECYTPATGNACRAYIWTSYVEAYETAVGYRYRPAQGWVFNNIVRFSDERTPGQVDLYGN